METGTRGLPGVLVTSKQVFNPSRKLAAAVLPWPGCGIGVALLAAAVAFASVSLAGCGARTGLYPYALTDAGGADTTPDAGSPKADKIDLLFMIDNSASMGDKQAILAAVVSDLVTRLVNPICVDDEGHASQVLPPGPTMACEQGYHREFNPVQDMNIGVISSSLGGHGADDCSPAAQDYGAWDPTMDDRGHLLTRGPGGGAVPTWQGLGFLAWDPAGLKEPPGNGDAKVLTQRFARLVAGAGERGCGMESQLEAWYRFLIDPLPYAQVVREPCTQGGSENDCSRAVGVDTEILQQRADFLRPDTLLAIVMLTDENDCSVADSGRGWRVGQNLSEDGLVMPPGTSTCVEQPGDPCCQPCDEPARPGCPDPASDERCHAVDNLSSNLRCWNQRQRFGVDLLYPISRYTRGLTEAWVPDRYGNPAPNPLYTGADGHPLARTPSLVYLAGIIGIPWQDLAVDPFDSEGLTYKTAEQIHGEGLWDVILGDPEHGVPPADAYMVESDTPRHGLNPATGEPIRGPESGSAQASPINGHEFTQEGAMVDLQYACIFRLPVPRDCADVDPEHYCDCHPDVGTSTRPVCQDDHGSFGTVQYYAKAYPGLRQLQVLRGIGSQAIVASICARNLTDPNRSDYGYRPALSAILQRLRDGLQ